MLITLFAITLSAPAFSQDNLVTPHFTLERNGVEVDAITVNVCTQFTIEVWVRGIPNGWFLTEVYFLGTANPDQVDLINVDRSDAEGRGWNVQIETPTGYIKYVATCPQAQIGYTADAVWLKVTLHCKATGTSEIKLTEGSLTFQIIGNGEKKIIFPPEALPVVTLTQRVPPPPPFTTPVGGVIIPVSKLVVLSPYLALVGLALASSTLYARRKRRKSKA
ncbi:MAG: hypothetical protein QXO32_00525 [Candidatus Bathyarchaeia archaeon]